MRRWFHITIFLIATFVGPAWGDNETVRAAKPAANDLTCAGALGDFGIEPPTKIQRSVEPGTRVTGQPYYQPSYHHVANSAGEELISPTEVRDRITPGLNAEGYHTIRPLGAGGMGAVFTAFDRNGNTVIIKASMLVDARRQTMFRAERDFTIEMSTLEKDSPQKHFLEVPADAPRNVTGVNGVQIPVIISREVRETPYDIRLARSLDSFTPEEIAQHPGMHEAIRRDVMAGLKKLHFSDKGLVHRDLKPGNVLIYFDAKNEPHARLIDLGLAAATRGVSPERTGLPFSGAGEGAVTGTPGSMSPSQLRGQAATPGDDLYALRRIDWYFHRDRLPAGDSGMVTRYLYPSAAVRDPLSGSGQASVSQNREYQEPRVALDHTDADGKILPERLRLVALAEFSNWPASVDERDLVLERAGKDSRATFFKWYVPKVLELDSERSLNRAMYEVRYHAAREFLNGTLMSETFVDDVAPTMKRADLEALVRGYYFQKAEAFHSIVSPTSQGAFGSHPQLNFDSFAKAVERLRERGLIGDPDHLRDEALSVRDQGVRYY